MLTTSQITRLLTPPPMAKKHEPKNPMDMILEYLGEHKQSCNQELRRYLNCSDTALISLMGRLEKAGIVKKHEVSRKMISPRGFVTYPKVKLWELV